MAHDLNDDEGLLAALRDAASAIDAVPSEAVLRARSALAYRRLDAALAELVADSAGDAPSGAVAGMRSAAAPTADRLLTFATGEHEVEVEVQVTPEGGRRIVGQVVPAGPALVELELEDPAVETTTLRTDGLGRFHTMASPGSGRFRVTWDDGARVETAWFLL